jgi:hypothetical protein
MIEVIAKKDCGFSALEDFTEISITKDDVKIVLDESDCEMLISVLRGKRGVMSHMKKGEYLPHKITLFSYDKSFNLIEKEDEILQSNTTH